MSVGSMTPTKERAKVLSFPAIIATVIWHSFDYERDFYIPETTITETEEARTKALSNAV